MSTEFVVIDPRIRFGMPQIDGVSTCVIGGRYKAGDTDVDDLAEDFGLTRQQVLIALAYERVIIDHRKDPDVVKWCSENPGRC
jgi:uncharacterized protein (DUF433 family)